MHKYEVTVWVDAGGEPADDPHLTVTVEAPDKHAAVDKARDHVRDNHPELNYMKIWTWSVRKLYT